MPYRRGVSLVEMLIVMSIVGMLMVATMQLLSRASSVHEMAMECGNQLRVASAIELRLRSDLAKASTVRADNPRQIALQADGSAKTIFYRCPADKLVERVVMEGDQQVARDQWQLTQPIEFEFNAERTATGRWLRRLALIPRQISDATAKMPMPERWEMVVLTSTKVD